MKVLFIDSSSKSLIELNHLFKQHRCQTAYTLDPVSGLKLLQQHAFDVVVAADNLARTSLENVLKAITLKFPRVVRIALLSNNDKAISQLTHYQYQQPIEQAELLNTVLSLSASHKQITKENVVKSVAKVKTLPSPPKVYLQLNEILKKSNVDSDKIAEIISQDPALTAKVLQFTNNTFARSDKPLTNISDAITKIGVDTLSCIVMTAELFSYQPNIANFSIVKEQLKALATAKLAASLVTSQLKQDAMLAGLLHGIGKLVLFEIDKTLTTEYFQNGAKTTDDISLERRIFSTDHCQVGAYLLHVWGFPYRFIEALLNQYTPEKLLQPTFGIAQATYLANALLQKQELNKGFIEHFALESKLESLQDKAAKLRL